MQLTDKLLRLENYPFHMPGHKRNKAFGIVGSDIDVTEIDGTDNLHNAENVILEIENELKKLYSSEKSFMLVGGSTLGILSAIYAVCNDGDTIIVARNCHKSVFNACVLKKLRVVYIEPEFDSTDGYYTGVTQESFDKAVSDNPTASAVVITSPTYEGNISHIETSLPLIIDCAHGAHFGLGNFPSYPKGDIVVSSLHKTLPALTQTAVINVYNKKYINAVKRYVDIFESSSPSYVLMDSVARCMEFIKNNKKEFFDYYDALCDFRKINLFRLRLKYSDDLSKIVISTALSNISGVKLACVLRDDYKIEVEMASERYVIFMTSVADTKAAFERLAAALTEIDSSLLSRTFVPAVKPPVLKTANVLSFDGKTDLCNIEECVGKISGEFVYAYPPDIPIISPNEIITKETIDYIISAKNSGVNIISDSNQLPNKLLTKESI